MKRAEEILTEILQNIMREFPPRISGYGGIGRRGGFRYYRASDGSPYQQ